MTDPVKLTPQEEEVQKQIKDLGLKDETIIVGEGEKETPAAPAAPETPAAPVTPAAPAAPAVAAPAAPAAPSKEEPGTLKEWAQREKDRADGERTRAEGLEAEVKRLRIALGTPVAPAQPEAEVNARKWMLDVLTSGGLLAEAIEKLPEDALDKHPSMVKRDRAIYITNDAVYQTQFLGRFEPKQRPVVQKRILPILQNQRAQSGYRDSYDDLYDKYAAGVREQAELVGLVVSEPGAAPAPQPGAPPAPAGPIPPSLTGVRGGGPPAGTTPEPLAIEDAKVLGLA